MHTCGCLCVNILRCAFGGGIVISRKRNSKDIPKEVVSEFKKVLKRPPWVNLSEEAPDAEMFQIELERAIKTTLLYETRPELLKSDVLDNQTMKLMNENKKRLPSLLQQVKLLYIKP